MPLTGTPVAPVSAADYCRRAIALKGRIETEFLGLGEMLQNIHDNKMFIGIFDSFEEFCAEMDFSESRASKLISVYQYFIKELNIEPLSLIRAGGYENLYLLSTLAQTKENQRAFVDETLTTLGTPTIGGRQKLLRQMKKGVDEATCECTDCYQLKICRACGTSQRVYEQTNSGNLQ